MGPNALNLRGGGVGCLWTSDAKLAAIGGKDWKPRPSCRVLKVQATGRRSGGGNDHNKKDRDGRRQDGDMDPSSGMGNYEKQTNPIFGKNRRETSKLINVDWRTFRANLVASEQMIGDELHRKNQMLIYKPSRKLSSKWAHPLSMTENGCLLIATEQLDGVPEFERSVILLLRSGMTGPGEDPFGVVLNQPLQKKMKQWKNINRDLADIFARCSIHFGGPLDDSMFLLRTGGFMHTQTFDEVIPGICFGSASNIEKAAELIMEGVVRPQDFRFFLGHAGWRLDQLKEEIEAGYWVVAACSPDLIKRTSSLTYSGLWKEVLQLMGGSYAELSKKPREESS